MYDILMEIAWDTFDLIHKDRKDVKVIKEIMDGSFVFLERNGTKSFVAVDATCLCNKADFHFCLLLFYLDNHQTAVISQI